MLISCIYLYIYKKMREIYPLKSIFIKCSSCEIFILNSKQVEYISCRFSINIYKIRRLGKNNFFEFFICKKIISNFQ